VYCIALDFGKKMVNFFSSKKVHLGDVAAEFSDLKMTWLLYCTGAATVSLLA